MATATDFFLGARPKTLSAAIAPVLIGASFAYIYEFSLQITVACLIVALALQIGVNFANDYSDGIKGTDKDRVGPMRLVGSGKASPRSVFIAMAISFLIAAIAGVYVASQSSWWLILIGAICIVLAWFYTGSSKPYGYFGLGEVVVFICFGLVATVGTFYANTLSITKEIVIASVIPGMFSVAVLLANNIRDIDTDKISNKKTLAVRIGSKSAKLMFHLSLISIFVSILVLGFLLPQVFALLLLTPILFLLYYKMKNASVAQNYIAILGIASISNLVFAIALSIVVLASKQL